jgi:hypothetical protein
VYLKGLVTIWACDLLFALIALPLALRKIPRNGAYGFRTPTTLSDDFIWYEANAHFGRGLLVSSLVSSLAILVLYNLPGLSAEHFLKASIAALAVPPLAAAFLTQRFVVKLRQRA